MKHVKAFEKFRIQKNREDIIKEAVYQVNDIYNVQVTVPITQAIINKYVQKVKETTGKNLRQFFGDVQLAEEITKWVMTNGLDVEKIPGGAILGGQTQAQGQAQVAPQAQTQETPQAQPEAQAPVEGQPQVQTQVQGEAQAPAEGQAQPAEGEFEEPQAQAPAQGQAQAPAQGQAQAPVQGEEEEEEEEELPI
jgi:hypothetical protein